ncbi:hypothetical protein BOTBODRAFT_176795 [Botryobasidium botryosum FD-172 SS1]|uniref:OPT family small oligopeptide transporter n=1 Tax=Botryobasidium botryosum (strain FD-172 SS1) TaxID=930990 RepID=A0A067M8Y6_BOTB1|nr:hypothetical protein BOTBODRAFT_176795 [Botryobasidium botryosum FD-172 SS1]
MATTRERSNSMEQREKASEKSFDVDVLDVKEEVVQGLEITDENQARIIFQQAEAITDEEAEEIMQEVLDEHRHDPAYPSHVIDIAQRFLENESVRNDPVEYMRVLKEAKMECALITQDSPYAEVRAVVSPHDDPSIACSTVRAWTIGLFLAISGGLINQLFSLRMPAISVDEIVAQLISYPMGVAWAKSVTTRKFKTFGYEWTLNPGPFTRKEHMLITVMANVSFNVGYSGYIIVVQRVPHFFNQQWAKDFGYQITLSLSFQLMGYGLAGLSRRFLVYPAAAIWPRNLASIALNNSFHTDENKPANGWKVSQSRFFLYGFIGMFCYFWFPNYIAEFLSYFSWITWISPNNVSLAAITGSVTGLGLNPWPTFDWNVIVAMNQVLIAPFFATANNGLGMIITVPIVAAIWYTNTWYTGHIPINTNRPYDNMGNRYNVSKIVNSNGMFNQEAYEAYSPLYLSASNAFLYGVFFAVYPATLIYAYLHHRHEIVRGFKSLLKRRSPKAAYRDVHNRLMSVYKEVPEWWYASLLLVALGLGLIAILKYPTHTTVGAMFFGVALAGVFVVPIGIIYAVTNNQVTLNVLAEFVGGLAFPGNALAMNSTSFVLHLYVETFFKSYGYVTTARTIMFAHDLKLGHYTKIPPRVMFASQTIATLLSTTAAMAILNWQVNGIKGICTPQAEAKFTCPGTTTFFTASVIWGTLGPIKMYGPKGPYNVLLWGFLIGAALPLIFHFFTKRYRSLKNIHIPVLLGGALQWAPYNISHVWPGMIVAYIFQSYIRKRYLPWWQKYNYVLSTALDCGVAICAIVSFFALQWKGVTIDWWGNNQPYEGCDGTGCPLFPVPESGHWGPGPGEFH